MMNETELQQQRTQFRAQAEALTQQRDSLAAQLEVVKSQLAQTVGALKMLEQILAPQPDSAAPDKKPEPQPKGDQK